MPRPVESAGRAPLALALVAFVLATTFVLAGSYFGVSYYLTSALVVIAALVPFFASFEAARPSARELAVIAVMCAIAVASRAAFFWLPAFKPMTGIVMIAGIAFGARAGFVAGSVSAFVSNFIFGQGTWTPWQMLAYGLAGLVAGLVAQAGVVPRHDLSARVRLVLSGAGALFVMLVLGPLLDTSTLFAIAAQPLQPESAAAVYIAGIPVNLVHALATFLTLLAVANPLLDKLERIRVKYGLLE